MSREWPREKACWSSSQYTYFADPRTPLLVVMGVVGLAPGLVYGQTDPQCFNDCTASGYGIPYCRQRCSLVKPTPPPLPLPRPPPSEPPHPAPPPLLAPPIRKFDPGCFTDCIRQGSMTKFCQQVRSYEP